MAYASLYFLPSSYDPEHTYNICMEGVINMTYTEQYPIMLYEAASASTTAIKDKLYPKVAALMDKNTSKYKKAVSDMISKRSKDLYDIAPCSNMFFIREDEEMFFKAVGIRPEEILEAVSKTYFYEIANFNPRSAKDPFTAMQTCIIRYYYLKKMPKELELSISVLLLSGKFYPSAFSMSFPTVAPAEYREIMVYAVNNEMSNKFDIKTTGSVFGALRSIGNTWIDTYDDMVKRLNDEDYVYIIQQLQTRLRSFMKNIAEVYYKCYEDKDYLTYDSDNFEEDSYRLADSDSLKADRVVEKTMTVINSSKADYAVCKSVSSDLCRIQEVQSIVDSIILDPNNQSEIKELIRLMVATYFAQSKNKDVRDIDFVTYSIAPKPNSKDKNIIRQKEIINNWLEKSPSNFNRRKSRLATANAYYRAVYGYFAIIIHNSNK